MNTTTYIDGQPWPPPGPDVVPASRRYRRDADGALVLVSETISEPSRFVPGTTAGHLTLERTPAPADRVAPPSRPAMNAGGFPAKPAKPTRPRQGNAAADSIPGLGASLTRVYRACERLAVGGVLDKRAVCDTLRLSWTTVGKYAVEMRRLGHFPWRWAAEAKVRQPLVVHPIKPDQSREGQIRSLIAVCDRTNVEGYVRVDVLCAALGVDAGELDRLIAGAKAQGFSYELMPGSDWIPATVADRQKGGAA